MTPQEKARELVDKYHSEINQEHNNGFTFELAKSCAIICADEMLIQLRKLRKPEYTDFIEWDQLKEKEVADTMDGYELIDWYENVKEEIQNL